MICERCGGDSGPYRKHANPFDCIAQLQSEIELMSAPAESVGAMLSELRRERDTLQFQLSDKDTYIASYRELAAEMLHYRHRRLLRYQRRVRRAVEALKAKLAEHERRKCETCHLWDVCCEQGECSHFARHTSRDFGCRAWQRKEA
jgi:hypothetical protein